MRTPARKLPPMATDIDLEVLTVKRIRRLLEDLTTTRSRQRALRYVLDALEEDAMMGAVPQPTHNPPKQPDLPFQNGKVDDADDAFGGLPDE